MRETKYSDILHLIQQKLKCRACYILMLNNSANILDYEGDIALSEKNMLRFNEFLKNNQEASNIEIASWESTQEVVKSHNLKSIKVLKLYKAHSTGYFLVLFLTPESRTEIIDDHSEKLINILAKLIELDLEIISQHSEVRSRTLIDAAIDFVFSLNGFGYIIEVNENGANALGYEVEEMQGNHFLDFIDETNRVEISEVFQKMLMCKTTTRFEIDFLHKLKRPVTYEFLATPILESGKIEGMMGIGRDISRRKKNEKEIKELNNKLNNANKLVSLERDRAKKQITVLEELNLLKNEFISNVSHELRTPLASIVGFAETLSSDENLTQENVKEFSDIIFAEGKRLARFIEDILDFSRLDDSKNMNKEKCSLIELINQAVSEITPIIEEKNVSLISEIPEAEITIFADKEKLSKAFLTIFENAVHYTESSGQITVFVQDFLKEVEIFVTDTGIGIPEKELKLFFEKFHSKGSSITKAPITGASLSLAKQIIEFHDGVLQVKSIVGEGTTMIVHLPKIIN